VLDRWGVVTTTLARQHDSSLRATQEGFSVAG